MLWLLLAAQAAALDHPWGRFSRAPALAHTSETVEIETDGADGGILHYELRLTRTRIRGPETAWRANSRTCPAVRPMLASLPALPTPRIAPPGFDNGEIVVVTDGIGYALHMPAAPYGSVDMTGNIGTPLAAWVDGALAQLAPCWSAVGSRVR